METTSSSEVCLELIQTLLGPGWEDAIVPFQILALGVFFRTAYRFASSIIMATGHVFAMSVCQAVYAVLVVLGAIIGSQWGIAGVAAATLAALLVFCLLLYGLAARVSGLSIRSLASAFVRPTLVFLVVLATSALSRSLLVGFGWAPWAIMLSAVCFGLAALIALTVVLRNRLWGDFLYEQVAGFQASRKNDGSF
jgi:O-antigen/teichoic acid export membrane protein